MAIILLGAGVTEFTKLADTPSSYSGQAGKLLAVNAAEDALEFVSAPSMALNDLTDVTISTPTAGHFLRYDGTNWVNTTIQAADLPSHTHTKADITDTPWDWTDVDKTGSSINDLGDVSISTPSAGHYLRYDGTNWVNSALQAADLPSHTHTKADITDTPWDWTDVDKTGSSINDLGDISISSPSSGQYLRYDGTNWVNSAIQLADLPTINLGDLGDVSISSPSDGQVLTYNASTGNWENKSPTAGGFESRVKAYLSANQDIAANTEDVIHFDSTVFDGLGEWDSANYRFTPSADGYYLVILEAEWNYMSSGQVGYAAIRKNGSIIARTRGAPAASDAHTYVVATIVYLTTSDYVDFVVKNPDSSSRALQGGAEYATNCCIHRLS